MTRRLLLVALYTLVVLAALPGQAGALRIGVGDQKRAMFSDPRFRELGIRDARVNVGWDVVDRPRQRRKLDRWLRAARRAEVRTLVSFGHARGRRKRVPTPAQSRAAFRRFRARWPQVRDFTVWNEANVCGEPVCHRWRLLGRLYRGMRRACPRCRVAGVELLDVVGVTDWTERYLAELRDLGIAPPRIWALHSYGDVGRLRDRRIRRLERIVPGRLWQTEVGGIVRRRVGKKIWKSRPLPEGSRRAARVTRYLFRTFLPRHPRITRVYVYHWNMHVEGHAWDSGLIGPDGRPRPAFGELARAIRVERRRRG